MPLTVKKKNKKKKRKKKQKNDVMKMGVIVKQNYFMKNLQGGNLKLFEKIACKHIS